MIAGPGQVWANIRKSKTRKCTTVIFSIKKKSGVGASPSNKNGKTQIPEIIRDPVELNGLVYMRAEGKREIQKDSHVSGLNIRPHLGANESKCCIKQEVFLDSFIHSKGVK